MSYGLVPPTVRWVSEQLSFGRAESTQRSTQRQHPSLGMIESIRSGSEVCSVVVLLCSAGLQSLAVRVRPL